MLNLGEVTGLSEKPDLPAVAAQSQLGPGGKQKLLS